jgi:hypothetical protein
MIARVLIVFLLFAARPVLSQSFGDSPFYKLNQQGSGSGAPFRWGPPDTRANGTSTNITMSVDFGFGTWREEMIVDGDSGKQILHWYAQFDRLNVTFGYDLLLEPIHGTKKIKCTFNTLTEPRRGFLRNNGSYLVPLPGPLTPLIITDGDTIAIRMFPQKPTDAPFTQYLHVRLD